MRRIIVRRKDFCSDGRRAVWHLDRQDDLNRLAPLDREPRGVSDHTGAGLQAPCRGCGEAVGVWPLAFRRIGAAVVGRAAVRAELSRCPRPGPNAIALRRGSRCGRGRRWDALQGGFHRWATKRGARSAGAGAAKYRAGGSSAMVRSWGPHRGVRPVAPSLSLRRRTL